MGHQTEGIDLLDAVIRRKPVAFAMGFSFFVFCAIIHLGVNSMVRLIALYEKASVGKRALFYLSPIFRLSFDFAR